jgi:hypothetical protein
MKKQALLCALLLVSYEYYNLKSASDTIPPSSAPPAAFHVPYILHSSVPKGYQYVLP